MTVQDAAAPRRGSIRVQLLAAYLAVALVPLAVVVQLDVWALEGALTASAHRALHASAAQTGVQVDAFLATNLGVVGTEARVPTFAEFLALPTPARSGEARRRVRRLLESMTERDRAYIISSTLVDRNGRAVADSRGEVPPTDSERECFRGGDFYVVNVVPIPHRFEERIAKTKHDDILHGVFAEVVIDTVHLPLVKHAQDRGIQVLG